MFVKNDFLYKGGDNLAFEVVKQISDIEREGEELVKKAGLKALEIQKSSREEADKIIEKAGFDANEYYKEVLSKYEL
jgi:vacuolar-type H+-ATPase subunit H